MTETTRSKPRARKTTKAAAKRTVTVAVPAKQEIPGQILSLPFLGATTVEDVTFYGVLGVVTVVKVVSWPTAALFGTVHVLHQRARNLAAHGHERGEMIEGTIEATEGVI
jgi:predicted S18 family serine protease